VSLYEDFSASCFLPARFLASGQSVCQEELKVFSKNDFKISYPSGWRVDTSGTMNSKVFFFSPLEGPDDNSAKI
jgi:hypothetical protein